MSSKSSETCSDNIGEDVCLGEESYNTPTPSSPDSCITNTLSCVTEEEIILKGDYEMDCCRGLPELTLAVIKPDGMKYLNSIEKRIRHEGFTIVQERRVHLSPEQVSNFYHDHYGQPYFPLLVSTMCEGPVKVYVLRRKDAVQMLRLLCGPTCVDEAKKTWPESLRAIYGTPGKNYKNVCHASETDEKANEEIRFFFPNMILDQNFLNEWNVENYIKERVNPILSEGLTQVCKNKPLDPILWLATWLLQNNPYKPKMKENISLTPT